MRDYGKLHHSFWTSPDIRSLSEDGRLLAAYLLSSPHTTIIGAFRLPDGYVQEDLQWGSERVSKGFEELFRNGFATRDEASKWVVIHKFLKWNAIENPNQAKAAVKVFDQMPSNYAVRHWIAEAFSLFAPQIPSSEYERFLNPSETVSEPFRNQEQEQEQEQKQERGATSVAAPPRKSKSLPTTVPDDFEFTAERQEFAASLGYPGQRGRSLFDQFCDNSRAKSVKYCNHEAGFRNWVRKQVEFDARRPPPSGRPSSHSRTPFV